MQKVGYLGPEGSYSRLAAEKLCGGEEYIAYPSFRALFAALEAGEVNAIVAPVSNTVNGAVAQNLDLLEEHLFHAEALTQLEINHRLIIREGAPLEKIERIYSHPQALEQCAKYLAAHFPEASLCATSSTAECLKKLTDDKYAGIVGAHVKERGFTLLEDAIADEKQNVTSFFKIVNGEYSFEGGQGDRFLICFTLKHKAGSLCSALKIFAKLGINMTELESRPIKDIPGEFRFFTEIMCDKKSAQKAVERLKKEALSIRVLGQY